MDPHRLSPDIPALLAAASPYLEPGLVIPTLRVDDLLADAATLELASDALSLTLADSNQVLHQCNAQGYPGGLPTQFGQYWASAERVLRAHIDQGPAVANSHLTPEEWQYWEERARIQEQYLSRVQWLGRALLEVLSFLATAADED